MLGERESNATSLAPAIAAEAVVHVDRVTKRFGDVTAVDDLSLEIRRGEFFSLLGPSGCGKTTSLRMIGGFEYPDEGVIRLGGKDVTDTPSYRRNVNTVFQSYALFPHLSVFDNVAYGLRRHRVAKPQIAARVEAILDLVDLAGFEARRPSQLSGGQQQRVALARALVNHPEVLLLDEPLGALDLKLRRQMQLELKRIQTELGITFLYVTHDQEEAMTMSDRIAVMQGGHVEQIGPPQDVYERPASEFVAGFLGASNLMVADVAAGEAAVTLSSGENIRLLPAELDGLRGQIKVGVRPEKIRLLTGAAAGSDLNVLDAVVRTATFVGVNYAYTVETASGETLQVYAQNLGTSAEGQPAAGARVKIAWHPEHTFAVRPSTQGGSDV